MHLIFETSVEFTDAGIDAVSKSVKTIEMFAIQNLIFDENVAPPFLPLALAAVKAAVVRSLINSRSNSPKSANIPKINFPIEVAVSIFAPCPCRRLSPTDQKHETTFILQKYSARIITKNVK